MLWLALHLPQLSLEAFCAGLPAQSTSSAGLPVQSTGSAGLPVQSRVSADLPTALTPQAVALVAEHRISAVDPAAAALGVRPGQRRATALALAPELLLGQADPVRDTQALHAVAHAALAFTPAVTLCSDAEPADTVLLEVSTCLRYFGGHNKLLSRLRADLAPLGHRLQIASAATALGAALLARWRDDLAQGAQSTQLPALQARLDSAPATLLAGAQQQALQGMGLQQLADLRRLPRAGLARRFGQPLLDRLDRAYGLRPDPRRWITPPPAFTSRLELFSRADSTEQVLHGATTLLARLVAWAQAQQARVAAFTLVMQHEPRHRDGGTPPATELAIELATPSAEAAHLQLLLRERLARCPLPAPTLELQLRCQRLSHRAPPNGELFPTRQTEHEGLLRLLERLRARLGDEQVQQLQARPDHRPEQAARLRALPPQPALAATALPEPTPLPLQHPIWLLPEPQALTERHAQPCWRGRALQLLTGPERIETGWWDGAVTARDYFIAQADDGTLLWVYRARLPSAGEAQWFLHGHYA